MSDWKDWDDEKKLTFVSALINEMSNESKLFFRVRGQDGELYYGQFNPDNADTFLGDIDSEKTLFIGVHELIGPVSADDFDGENIIPFPKN